MTQCQIVCRHSLDRSEPVELLILPFWEGPMEAADLSSWKGPLSHALKSGDFKGKAGETLLLYEESRLLLLGLGKQSEVNPEALRRAYAAAMRVVQAKKSQTLHAIVPLVDSEPLLRGFVEGILLTNYAFTRLKHDSLKNDPIVLLHRVTLIGMNARIEGHLQKWQAITAGVFLVRELVNGNADEINPDKLAKEALSLAKSAPNLKATILNKQQIEEEKMGLLLAVNRGSSLDPALIQLSYQGNPHSKEQIVLIGKGITYDTGGLSLKPTEGMLAMKCDMSGGATVLAAVHTAAAIGLKVNVTALVPATENAIDAKSYKVGDVYRSMSGKTVEVTNTDAEGRLVLADAMSYAVKYLHPTLMIDVASLTGAIVIALGEEMAGLFSNQDALARELADSSEATGELLWRMPLYADYKEMLKSDIADLMNSAGRPAGSMTAALFLQEFCESIPWAHIDFAGSCFLTKPKHYYTTKATGFGVRLLVDFLERRSV